MGCAADDIFPAIENNLANPLYITIDSNLNRAYLINSNNKYYYDTGALHVLDISTPTAPSLVTNGVTVLDSFSGETYLDSANGFLYTANRLSDDNQDTTDRLLKINIDEASANFLNIDELTAGDNPFAMAADLVNSILYVSNLGGTLDYYSLPEPSTPTSMSLADIALSDETIIETSEPRDMAIIGSQAFVTLSDGGIFVIDLSEYDVDYYISDLASPRGIATDGAYLFVANAEIDDNNDYTYRLFVLDPSTLTVRSENTDVTIVDKDDDSLLTAEVEIDADPEEVLVSTDYIFVTNYDADSVTVTNRVDFTKNTDITVGDEPFGMAVYSPAGVDTHLFVTNVQNNSVSIIDLSTLAVAATYQ